MRRGAFSKLGFIANDLPKNGISYSKKAKGFAPIGRKALYMLGWLMGLEPTTTGITILCDYSIKSNAWVIYLEDAHHGQPHKL